MYQNSQICWEIWFVGKSTRKENKIKGKFALFEFHATTARLLLVSTETLQSAILKCLQFSQQCREYFLIHIYFWKQRISKSNWCARHQPHPSLAKISELACWESTRILIGAHLCRVFCMDLLLFLQYVGNWNNAKKKVLK